MTDVADVLLAAGATDLVHAAASGSVTGMLTDATPEGDRVAALRIAAERGKLSVIDELLAAGTPIEGWTGTGPPHFTRPPTVAGPMASGTSSSAVPIPPGVTPDSTAHPSAGHVPDGEKRSAPDTATTRSKHFWRH